MLRLGRALRFVWESGPKWTLASVALLFVQGVVPLLTLYLMKLMIDGVAAGIGAPDKGAAFRHVAFLIGLGGLVALTSTLVDAIATVVSDAQSQVVTDHMQGMLHAKSIEVDLEYYENTQYYDTLHRAQQEAPYRPTRIVRGLIQLGQSTVSLLGIGFLLFSFHWAIAIVVMVAAIPGALVRVKSANELYQWRRKQTPRERQMEYLNALLTHNIFAKEVRLFGSGPLFMYRSRDLRRQICEERLQLAVRRSVRESAAQLAAIIPVFGTYAFMAYRAVHGAITLGALVMYYQAFQRGQSALQSILNSLVALYEDNLFISNLYEFLDVKPKVAQPLEPKPVPRAMQRGVVVDHLDFQYPGSRRYALEDVSLTLRPGEVVALVGENGSGKTTLVKLLCRLYDPTGGRITIDGIDLRQFSTTALRQEISVIFQDFVTYHLTARENIWLGNLDLPRNHERIVAAARHAGADEVIAALRDGYDTILGKWLGDGEELSIGQWQKVALARAFFRDAQLMILDEPTSALDPMAEAEVFVKFRELIGGRSAILISHRLSTVRMADRIYVMERGRIVESGRHEELVHRGSRYANLFETQARNYK